MSWHGLFGQVWHRASLIVPMLLRSALSRRTICDDCRNAFPSGQFWVHSNNCVWWDANYLHNFVVREASAAEKRNHWLKWFAKFVRRNLTGEPELFHFASNAIGRPPGAYLEENVCSTLALYTYMWVAQEKCSDKVLRDYSTMFLNYRLFYLLTCIPTFTFVPTCLLTCFTYFFKRRQLKKIVI